MKASKKGKKSEVSKNKRKEEEKRRGPASLMLRHRELPICLFPLLPVDFESDKRPWIEERKTKRVR